MEGGGLLSRTKTKNGLSGVREAGEGNTQMRYAVRKEHKELNEII